jgi:hypothetical protein
LRDGEKLSKADLLAIILKVRQETFKAGMRVQNVPISSSSMGKSHDWMLLHYSTVGPAGFEVACSACAKSPFCVTTPVCSDGGDIVKYCAAISYNYLK